MCFTLQQPSYVGRGEKGKERVGGGRDPTTDPKTLFYSISDFHGCLEIDGGRTKLEFTDGARASIFFFFFFCGTGV
jgi:hypothetical protein